jgi:membrane protease YdiL (CAAX protease family)
MSTMPPPELPEPFGPPPGHPRSAIANVFIGPQGLRAGWRALGFVGITVGLLVGFQFAVSRMPAVLRAIHAQGQQHVMSPGLMLISEALFCFCALVAATLMARVENRSVADYGLRGGGAGGKFFMQGIVWGLAEISALMLMIAARHGFSFGSLALHGGELVRYTLLWALVFLLVGFFEEFTFRGYLQHAFQQGIGFWPAAILASAIFGGSHLRNPGEDWVGALTAGLFGILACLTLRRTGSIWLAIGMHAGFDFGETFVFSVPDSGMPPSHGLLNSSLAHGPTWLTGGSVGPEGSVFAIIVLVVAIVAVHFVYPAGHWAASAPDYGYTAMKRVMRSPLLPGMTHRFDIAGGPSLE